MFEHWRLLVVVALLILATACETCETESSTTFVGLDGAERTVHFEDHTDYEIFPEVRARAACWGGTARGWWALTKLQPNLWIPEELPDRTRCCRTRPGFAPSWTC